MGTPDPPQDGKYCEERERLLKAYEEAAQNWDRLTVRLGKLIKRRDPMDRAGRMLDTINAREEARLAKAAYEAHRAEHGC
jgi:hypothetical protein